MERCPSKASQLSQFSQLTQFGLDEAVGDAQVLGGDGLSIDQPQQRELRGQAVHDHGQVSLSDLQPRKKRNKVHPTWLPWQPQRAVLSFFFFF